MYEIITQSLRKLVDFTDEELFTFMQKLKPVTLKKFGFYLKEGQVCKGMVIVQKGCLRYFSRGEKGDHTMGFAFESEWLGRLRKLFAASPLRGFY